MSGKTMGELKKGFTSLINELFVVDGEGEAL